jgi:hypothetical protein
MPVAEQGLGHVGRGDLGAGGTVVVGGEGVGDDREEVLRRLG